MQRKLREAVPDDRDPNVTTWTGMGTRRLPINNCVVRVGRLIEVSVPRGFATPGDVDDIIRSFMEAARHLPGTGHHIALADYRGCTVMSREASDRAAVLFSGESELTLRMAFVCGKADSPTAVWQLLRLTAAGHADNRKVFTDVEEALGWVDQVLTPEERVRAREFMKVPPLASSQLIPSYPPRR